MLARLSLSETEQKMVVDLLLSYTRDRSSIVKTMAMQALYDLSERYEMLQPAVRTHLEELVAIGTPAMKARGKKLLARLHRR